MVPVRRNQNWLPSIFNDFLTNDWLMERRNTTAPAVNIIENDDEYKIEVAAPGMTREDFKVHINEDNELIISMEKRSEEKEEDKKHKGTYLRREFSYTQFQQSLLLPDNVERDKISAKVEHGVMSIDIPKKKVTETASAARQIEIK
ncbi:Hsp20/alpha crystallin family protein [Alistipes sp. An66]|uniref:Hsp20/alpha crystallin family protein n=1 Tax=Alistipes sp. An66 TaxID=1965650 RepID=UPI000B3A1F20|nr:Hsp20/alpha crystallin family protein [Alistipes sp. An66]OUN60204.1 heat-shock protein [Alistipes sp. An66]HIY15394.1 Hsp20/alpha crystallin family protein [Candidatus Alistipes cottocaccae]